MSKWTIQDVIKVADQEDKMFRKTQSSDVKIKDELGPFYIVTKASNISEPGDILFKSDINYFILQIKGGLNIKEIVYIGHDRQRAIAYAVKELRKSGE